MKQNTTASQTLTKQDLVDALKDFRKEIQTDIKAVEMQLEIKMDEMELRIQDREREHHSEVLTRFDGWAGELEIAREDRVIATKQLHDHEKRIKILEKAQN